MATNEGGQMIIVPTKKTRPIQSSSYHVDFEHLALTGRLSCRPVSRLLLLRAALLRCVCQQSAVVPSYLIYLASSLVLKIALRWLGRKAGWRAASTVGQVKKKRG